ncbi:MULTISPECIES: Ig-like domain-containing protein [unclassified Marinobacter]|uniref:Ig-like domain-containing protein n=1 Tax=unclassified Marinobacter TaxID=83889 RepID=UPI00273B4B5F|nr:MULTISPECIES: Ig-like domain-containing protein [unclassified Marinobacter]MDP4548225.1 Ig-like domain-containing protein [Marinobacter sp. MDS2]
MKQFKTLALIPAMLLAACGGSDEQEIKQSVKDSNQSVSLVYSYPMDGQADVSPKADIVLRFSHAIADDDTTLAQKIQVDSSAGSPAFTVTKIDGGKSLKLEIAEGQTLASRETYSITFNEPLLTESGREINTPNAVGEPGIQFDTRGEFSGVAELAQTSDDFAVAWQVPANGTAFEAANFSTFRLALTHPVHPEWQKHGGSIELLDKNGAAVPATVLVKGNRVTVDPCVTEDPKECGSKDDILNAGQEYTLKLNNLASLTNGPDGARLSKSFNFTPRATGPTVLLEQEAVTSNGGNITSILNGQPINGVVLNSVLQGVTDSSQQTGSLFAELAYAPSFEADEALPLRIPKGSVLESTSLNIKVGGKVQVLNIDDGSNQETGTIKVTMLSDASGYMSPNAYTDDINAPRHITLFMDVSMNTAEAMPNAGLSQDLMGVELRGIALVQDGVLTIDAIGMVEPNLLGQEVTDSTIAFHLQAATDVDSVLDAEVLRESDNTAPQLLSWMPGADNANPSTRQSMQRPGDPVILFFDEPLDPASIAGGVTLFADNSPVETLRSKLDGTALVLNPKGGLEHGVEYRVEADGLSDLAGNIASVPSLTFELDPIDSSESPVTQRPPLALTTYPGFPCETDFTNMNLVAGDLGECFSIRQAGHEKGNAKIEVDLLPVDTMPSDRPITVVFSQTMDAKTISLGKDGTFIVEKVTVNESGKPNESEIGSGEIVSGRLELNEQRLRFFPDQPWEPGKFYRYTMRSVASEVNQLELKSNILEGLNAPGRDGLTIYFEGAEKQDTVFTALRNFPVRDTNSNFIIDCADNYDASCLEPFEAAHEGLGNDVDGWGPSANATKLAVIGGKATAKMFDTGSTGIPLTDPDARVGCPAGTTGSTILNRGDAHPDCPRKKFIYQTYALNTEVLGPGTYDPTPEQPNSGDEIEGIRVDLYPTLLTTSSISVFTQLEVLGLLLQEESITNTQVLRMRYAKDDPSCETDCSRKSLIPGVIAKGDKGQPVFITQAELLIDAPDMEIPMGGTHDLYGRAFTLELEGDITFFDDGRMQIEQINTNRVGTEGELLVTADALGIPNAGLATIRLPLEIPVGGTYLNFITNPVKDLPAQYEQQTAPQ